tara:strand:+ start:13793 stop:14494 length:702 start_codon:yes stop_codon:yes gene_type:complete
MQRPSIISAVLRGDPDTEVPVWLCISGILLGCGLYGFAIGSWRAPHMGLYVGVKFPLLILATLCGTGLMNGILGQLIGSGLSFADSFKSQLTSFLIFSLLLGSLSPIAFLLAFEMPGWTDELKFESYRSQVHIHTGVIAYAGLLANHKLYRILQSRIGNLTTARQTLVIWLAGNLFVGAQLSWNLRPFFGSPYTGVEFLRSDWRDKTFYESIFTSLSQTLGLYPHTYTSNDKS